MNLTDFISKGSLKSVLPEKREQQNVYGVPEHVFFADEGDEIQLLLFTPVE
ncbi:hypothetical protein SAMN05877753_106107 [Bacillus oleivorans]|uniref:Uncharacterized protein n=2 Tax=Bacillus oleivorans TaxID=1448271 RepID=A0A285CYD5_9BACI|nr:hypothetical protein SAMN05877753_106107 [Bacillus oleivorans]